ncbi:MAG: phosphoserine transaminase [Coxiella sp. RIFCSPHIGHO2_12_FULL_42_15]|nr:MAG: phosphoserine transaminase [Coxiella sp. RIFCSPHIGHO2_12_FULL_42_15]
MTRVYNFSAGPAQLPDEVLLQIRDELFDWQGTGMSVMEMPHRGDIFDGIAKTAEQDLRDLLAIPSHYKVLFLHGGGRSQFAMVPLNLGFQAANLTYLETGTWSQLAVEEAKRFGHVHVAASSSENHYTDIPARSQWSVPEDSAYLHYTDNETIHGIEFSLPPNVNMPLVSDMSSNLLSKPIDVNQFGIIYACAQKNLGIAGITIVIIRDDLLQRTVFPHTPSMFHYALHAEQHSFLNTPPTFSWYVSGLVFKWIKQQGGVAEMEQRRKARAEKLYAFIDHSEFYFNPVKRHCRSCMNVPFILSNPDLNAKFLTEAEKAGLVNLKGHRLVGGMRASMYNAMPLQGVDALIEFMHAFEKQN